LRPTGCICFVGNISQDNPHPESWTWVWTELCPVPPPEHNALNRSTANLWRHQADVVGSAARGMVFRDEASPQRFTPQPPAP